MTECRINIRSIQQISTGVTTQSVAGLTCKLVHVNTEAGLCWVVNPVTGHVCRVSLADVDDGSFEAMRMFMCKPSGSAASRSTATPTPGYHLRSLPTEELIAEMQRRAKGNIGYILWNPGSRLPPKVTYPTLSKAKEVGEIMARRNKNEPFHIALILGTAINKTQRKRRIVYDEVDNVEVSL